MNNYKPYPVTYNKEHYTVMANDIIKGKQEMTLQEARIVRLLVTQVVKQDKDLKTYTCRIQDLAKFIGIDSSNLYKGIQKFCSDLLGLQVRVGTGNPKEPWEIFQWIQLAKYDGKGNLTLMLSNQIKPYVVELDKWFTQYQLCNILAMQSFYSIRLYELIKCQDGVTRTEKNYHEFTIEYLREYFCCEKKYQRISQFKEKVIEIAVKEINKKSDMRINPVEYIKTSRAITSVRFFVHLNYNQLQLAGKINLFGDSDTK
jgi:plasmid replication initiation protein